jgi:ubiquinone/menaquinone biosynthesis C-methylase UbiE
MLTRLMKRRGFSKWQWITSNLSAGELEREHLRVFDLGAGEGWVGHAAQDDLARQGRTPSITLADVVDMNVTTLPHIVYDGHTLPMRADSYDLVVLVFVLHHASDPETVLREVRRVLRSDGTVVVIESVYTNGMNHALLRILDRLANRLRSRGAMNAQEAHLAFDTAEGWRRRFEALGLCPIREASRGRWVHQQHLFVLRPC